MSNVSRLPPRKPRQLRRAALKLGARTLPHARLVLRLGPLRLYRDGSGRVLWRWRKGPLRAAWPPGAPVP